MPAIDRHPNHQAGLDSPAEDYVAVTPDDGAELGFVTRAVHLGTAGVLRVLNRAGVERTTAILTAGWHPLRVRKIFQTGTTAGEITAAW